MAGELQFRHSATGATLYAVIRSHITGQVVVQADGSLETQVNANWGTYDITLTETPAGGYYYVGDMPAASSGLYVGEVYLQVGGAPATTDTIVGWFSLPFTWNGTAVVSPTPYAASDVAGGLPISDAGGLDLDTQLANTNEITVARMGVLTDWIDGGRLDLILDAVDTNAARLTAVRAAVLTDLIDGGRLDLILDAVLVDTGTTLPATIAALNNLSTAQVNAQMLDVLNVDELVAGETIAEALRRIGAITSGVVSGAGTGTETFLDYEGSVHTVVVIVDGNGNRFSVVYN